MASTFDYHRAKWVKNGDAPIVDRYERMYYPVIKLLSHSEETRSGSLPRKSTLRPSLIREETLPLQHSQTMESLGFAEAENVLVASPSKVNLLKPRSKKKTIGDYLAEPIVWNRWKAWTIVLIVMCFILLFAISFTWAVTRAVFMNTPPRDVDLVVYGSVSFLVKEGHKVRHVRDATNASSPSTQKARRTGICRLGSPECQEKWKGFLDRYEDTDCQLDPHQDNSQWEMQQKLADYILHNSSLCTWHRCRSFGICCWRNPTQKNGVAYLGYNLVISPRGTCASQVDLHLFSSLKSKIASMLSQSPIHHIIQDYTHPARFRRPSAYREVRSCVYVVDFEDSKTCPLSRVCQSKDISLNRF